MTSGNDKVKEKREVGSHETEESPSDAVHQRRVALSWKVKKHQVSILQEIPRQTNTRDWDTLMVECLSVTWTIVQSQWIELSWQAFREQRLKGQEGRAVTVHS